MKRIVLFTYTDIFMQYSVSKKNKVNRKIIKKIKDEESKERK
jgi:hypothetical protein